MNFTDNVDSVNNVVPIKQSIAIAETLRSIADAIDSGEYPATSATLVLDSLVFHMGPVSEQAAIQDAIWNMTFGIHKIMGMVT